MVKRAIRSTRVRNWLRSSSAGAAGAGSTGGSAGTIIASVSSMSSCSTTTSLVNTRSVAPKASSPCNVAGRSEEHTSELQSLMRISYAVFCLKKKKTKKKDNNISTINEYHSSTYKYRKHEL